MCVRTQAGRMLVKSLKAGDVRVETNAFRETGCFDFSRDVNVSWSRSAKSWMEWRGREKRRKGEESWVTTRRENFLRGNLFRITTHGWQIREALSRETRWQMLTRKRSNNMHPPALSRLSRRNAKFHPRFRQSASSRGDVPTWHPNKGEETIDKSVGETLEN